MSGYSTWNQAWPAFNKPSVLHWEGSDAGLVPKALQHLEIRREETFQRYTAMIAMNNMVGRLERYADELQPKGFRRVLRELGITRKTQQEVLLDTEIEAFREEVGVLSLSLLATMMLQRKARLGEIEDRPSFY